MSNSLDSDQTRQFVGSDLVPNCLQSLSVRDDTSRERSGSVVECLTRDRGAAGSSLTGGSLSKTHLSQLSTGSTQEDLSLFN